MKGFDIDNLSIEVRDDACGQYIIVTDLGHEADDMSESDLVGALYCIDEVNAVALLNEGFTVSWGNSEAKYALACILHGHMRVVYVGYYDLLELREKGATMFRGFMPELDEAEELFNMGF